MASFRAGPKRQICLTSETHALPTFIYYFKDLTTPKKAEPVESPVRGRSSKDRVGRRGRG